MLTTDIFGRQKDKYCVTKETLNNSFKIWERLGRTFIALGQKFI